MLEFDHTKIDWEKSDGLIPAIIQDANNLRVLMLGYMNMQALQKTLLEKKVTFFSRSRKCLWMKGETSGNVLNVVSVQLDCDGDTLLVQAIPQGPTCHTGTQTCFSDEQADLLFVLRDLSCLIHKRSIDRPAGSYTTTLFEQGIYKIAQKVGEEGVELALAGVKGNKDDIANECADLIFHALVLLESNQMDLDDVLRVLVARNTGKK